MVQRRRKSTKKIRGGGCGCSSGAGQSPTAASLGLFSGGGRRKRKSRKMRGGNSNSSILPSDTVIPYTSNYTDRLPNYVPSRLIGGRRKMRGGSMFSSWSSSLNNLMGNGVTNIGGLSDINSSSAGLNILQNRNPPSEVMGLVKPPNFA